MEDSVKRDAKIFEILDREPKSIFNFLKRTKNNGSVAQAQRLVVGDKVYEGE